MKNYNPAQEGFNQAVIDNEQRGLSTEQAKLVKDVLKTSNYQVTYRPWDQTFTIRRGKNKKASFYLDGLELLKVTER